MSTIRESVNRIELALVGDVKLGHTGFAERLAILESKVAEHDRKLWIWSGGAAVASVIITKFWHQLVS